MKLTDDELAALPAKAQREPEVLELYKTHAFLEAYALHTDRRIELTGYRAAIGGGDNWESHGDLQRDFLISAGLLPSHRFLEIGCGTGRLARKLVPYLDVENYTGVDISEGALANARRLALAEGWYVREPAFVHGTVPHDQTFDYVWAFSVFIHLPADVTTDVMRAVAGAMHEGSAFYFSYVPEAADYRSGVKQFRKTLKTYKRCAAAAGLTFHEVERWIKRAGHRQDRSTGSQRVAVATLQRSECPPSR